MLYESMVLGFQRPLDSQLRWFAPHGAISEAVGGTKAFAHGSGLCQGDAKCCRCWQILDR